MPIILKADAERLTLDDLIVIEDAGTMKARQLKQLLSRFVVDAQGQAVPAEQAATQIGRLSLAELRAAMEQFGATLKGVQDAAVPPEIGSG